MREGIHGGKENLVSLKYGFIPNGKGKMGLAGARGANEDEIKGFVKPFKAFERGKLLPGYAFLEAGIKLTERLLIGKSCLFDTLCYSAFIPGFHFLAE